MSKILKVTIEYDDKTVEVDGPEAEKWERHNQSLASLAYVHRMNPFDSDPVKWNRQAKDELIKTNQRLEQKIDQDRLNNLQDRLWRMEDRLQDRKPTELEKEEIRKLQMEKEQLDKSLKTK